MELEILKWLSVQSSLDFSSVSRPGLAPQANTVQHTHCDMCDTRGNIKHYTFSVHKNSLLDSLPPTATAIVTARRFATHATRINGRHRVCVAAATATTTT